MVSVLYCTQCERVGLTETHLWQKGGSRRQSRRRDKLGNFDRLSRGGAGLHL